MQYKRENNYRTEIEKLKNYNSLLLKKLDHLLGNIEGKIIIVAETEIEEIHALLDMQHKIAKG